MWRSKALKYSRELNWAKQAMLWAVNLVILVMNIVSKKLVRNLSDQEYGKEVNPLVNSEVIQI